MNTQTFIAGITHPKTLAGRSRTACTTSLLPLLLLLALPAVVQADDYTYGITDGTVTITGYTGPGGNVIIPSTINGLPVTSIGDYAFQRCTSLTNVRIPNSVTSIGDNVFFSCGSLTNVTIGSGVTSIGGWAFEDCTNLTTITVDTNNPAYSSVDEVLCDKSQTTLVTCPEGRAGSYTIPDSVTSIGFEAFDGCAKLTSVTLPNSVTNIGDWAFSSCTSLTTITVDTNNRAYSSVDGVLCDKSQTTLLDFPGGRAGSYTIPNSVTSIGDWAFQFCCLASVTIGRSVTNIGEGAFANCDGLTSATIPNGVTSIGVSAFGECPSLTSVTIPDSVTYMGAAAFEYCGLTSVTIGRGLTNIADAAFGMCARLTSATIPNSVTSIGVEAFDGCARLTNVTIPNSVTSLENGAFEYCPSLTSITLPNSVTSIGDEAFYECTNLTAIYCWGNAPTLGLDVFDWDDYATVFYLSGTTGWGPTLGDRPTVMWNPAGGVYIVRQPQGVATNVGATVSFRVLASGTAPLSYQWWKGATNLTGATNITFTITNVQLADAGHYTVVVTDGGGSTTSQVAILDVYAMPPGGFLYRPNANSTVTITGYTGPGGVVDIPGTINGLSVVAIGDDAFYYCNYCASLTSITMPDSVTSIGLRAFSGCASLTNLTIPNRVSSIGGYAFGGCGSLTGVMLPNTVTSIGEGALSGCSSLTRVTIPNGVTSIGSLTFLNCLRLTSVTIPDSVTRIGDLAFDDCTSLANIMIPDSVTSIGAWAFGNCTSVTNVTIPNRVASIADGAFGNCTSLTSLTIPDSVTSLGWGAFSVCTSLTNVTIPDSVTNIGDTAFWGCTNLTGIHFTGNAPSLGGVKVFTGDSNLIVYYVPGTAGWGATYGGVPTAPWVQVPAILVPPPTQTAEAGATVALGARVSSPLPLYYLWYLNNTNLISCSTNSGLELTGVQFSQSGAYTVVISNVLGAITSAPVMLNVIAPVERRPVPGIKVAGGAGSLLNVDYANSLSPAPSWAPLGSVSLASTSQYYFDLTLPLPPQRFYRAWQAGTPGLRPFLDLRLVPALTLTGSIGQSLRLDYINQFGPIDAWVTLATVTLTNASQLYFDTSAAGQPQRLYRLVMP